MHLNQSKTKFEQADQYLEAAQSELNRPAEDVVPHMVSSGARHAIHYYLQGFLLTRKVDFSDTDSVDTLLEKCRAIDNKFQGLHLGTSKAEEENKFRTKLDEANHLVDIASRAKELVG